MSKKIVYVSSDKLLSECDKIPVAKSRASMVHSLICAYELDQYFSTVIPRLASEFDLALFHSKLYITHLKKHNQTAVARNEDIEPLSPTESDASCCSDEIEEQLDYGIGYDCPNLVNLWAFVTTIAGGTITAAEELINGAFISINWCGGWHHAQRDEAEGFCYINDICIGIQRLRDKFKRILYIDLDVHHGNGMENAFSYSKRVFTLSFHQYEAGFYPGTGGVNEVGVGPGKGYSCNFPYKSFVSGELFCRYFERVATCVKEVYQPDACVVQCGADAIAGDPLGGTNVLPVDLGKCISKILDWKLPTMFLGGGGYHLTNTARYWTYLTSIICNRQLDDDIPDHKYFLKYGPGYELNILPNRMTDLNTEKDFEHIFQKIKKNLQQYNVSAV